MESRWTSAIILLVSLTVLVIFVGQVFFPGGGKVSTETAYAYSMTEDIPFVGVYLRDEVPVYSSGGTGVLSYECEDGSKVGKSSVIARRYRVESDIDRRSEIEELRAQIEVLTEAEKLVGTDNTQLESIASQINEKHSSIVECLINGDYSAASDLKNDMLEVLCKREVAMGSVSGYSERIAELQSRISELQSQISGEVQNVYANGTGYFVSHVDGYEDKLSFSQEDISAERIESIIANPDISSGGNTVGKLIADYRWRAAAVLDKENMYGLYENSSVTLRVGSDAAPLEARIVSISDTNRGDNTAVYIFECDRLTSAVVGGRTAQFKLVVNSYGGLRVSRSAIRYNDDEERGVFVVRSGKLDFRKINVIYWGTDYVICTQEEGDGYLKLYDKIVTEGKDLYDGKVVE